MGMWMIGYEINENYETAMVTWWVLISSSSCGLPYATANLYICNSIGCGILLNLCYIILYMWMKVMISFHEISDKKIIGSTY